MTMALHRKRSRTVASPPVTRSSVRVLRGESELAEAAARAEEGARRLKDRLDARAAKDSRLSDDTGKRLGWREFAKGAGANASDGRDGGRSAAPHSPAA